MNIYTKYVMLVIVLFTSMQTIARAAIYSEVGDTGELLTTAQLTRGTGALDTINGSLIDLGNQVDDVDLFKINIIEPNAFSVFVTANLSADNDATMYLFNNIGEQVLFDDDGDGNDLLPAFMLGSLAGFDSGFYYLGFSLLFTEPVFDGGQLNAWNRDPDLFQTGDYQFSLTGSEFALAVPEPASLWLMLLGMIAYFTMQPGRVYLCLKA